MHEQHASEKADLQACLAEERRRSAEAERRADLEAENGVAAAAVATARISALEAELQRQRRRVTDTGGGAAGSDKAQAGRLTPTHEGCSSMSASGRLTRMDVGGVVESGTVIRVGAAPDACVMMQPRTCGDMGQPLQAEEVRLLCSDVRQCGAHARILHADAASIVNQA